MESNLPQSDYWQATKAAGHGDFHLISFAPSSVQEMADTVQLAFDLADQYRMPALILADGLLGQMMEPVSFAEDTSEIAPVENHGLRTDIKTKENITL